MPWSRARREPPDTIIDPACGTGGFLIATSAYIERHYGATMTSDKRRRQQNQRITSGGCGIFLADVRPDDVGRPERPDQLVRQCDRD